MATTETARTPARTVAPTGTAVTPLPRASAECRGGQRDRGCSKHPDRNELVVCHTERAQRRVPRRRKRRHTHERLGQQDKGKQRADGSRQPERLCLVMDRAFDLGRLVLL